MLPKLPPRGKGQGPWSSRTRRVYDGWRADPVTQTFGENEIAATIELAFLQEELVRGRVSLASEIRQRADGLALTPRGRRDLRFRLHGPADIVKLEQPDRPRRRRLRAVE